MYFIIHLVSMNLFRVEVQEEEEEESKHACKEQSNKNIKINYKLIRA